MWLVNKVSILQQGTFLSIEAMYSVCSELGVVRRSGALMQLEDMIIVPENIICVNMMCDGSYHLCTG